MSELLVGLLGLLGVIVTAIVTHLAGKRSARVQKQQQETEQELGLIDRYRSEIDRIDDKLDEQSEDIVRLTQQNVERTEEVLKLREEMARVRRDHIAETAKLETTLLTFRTYIASVLEWINRRFETGELDTDANIPEPPPEYRA